MASVIQAMVLADLLLSEKKTQQIFQDTQGRTRDRTTLYLLGYILTF